MFIIVVEPARREILQKNMVKLVILFVWMVVGFAAD